MGQVSDLSGPRGRYDRPLGGRAQRSATEERVSEDTTITEPASTEPTSTEPAPTGANAPAPGLWTRLGPAALLGLLWAVLPGIMGFALFFGVRAEVAEWFRSHDLPLALTLYIAAFIGYYIQIGELEPKQVFQDYAMPHLQRAAARRANDRDDALARPASKPAQDEAH